MSNRFQAMSGNDQSNAESMDRRRNIGKALIVCSNLALAASLFYGPGWLQSFAVATALAMLIWGGVLMVSADVSFLSQREIAEWEERRSERAARRTFMRGLRRAAGE